MSPDDLMATIEAEVSPTFDRGAAFARARDLYADQGAAEKARAAALDAGLFQSVKVHASVKPRALAPDTRSKQGEKQQGADDGRQGSREERYPTEDAYRTPDAIAHYAQRLAATQNPILKARYADYLWGRTPRGQEWVGYGRAAIDAYIACADLYLHTPKQPQKNTDSQPWPDDYDYMEAADAAMRAWRIAPAMGNQKLIATVEQAVLDILARMEQLQHYRWCSDIIAALFGRPRNAGAIPAAHLLAVVSRAMSYFSERIGARPQDAPTYFLMLHDYHDLQLRLLKAQGASEEKQRASRCAHAALYEQEAAHTLVHRARPHLVAADALKKALPIYQELGEQVKANEIKLRITEAQRTARETGQFGATVVEGALDCAWIEALRTQMVPPYSAAQFVSDVALARIPKVATMRANLLEEAAQSPLMICLSRVLYRNDNAEVATDNPEERAFPNSLRKGVG